MERIIPLCTMSAAPWFRALKGWAKLGGQVEKDTSKPSVLQKTASHGHVDGGIEDRPEGLHQTQ